MQLNKIIPWGRTLAEYRAMFDLSDADLARKILGCGDGSASFNAEMTALGHSVLSVTEARLSTIRLLRSSYPRVV